MLTSIKIANRINAHLGIPPSSGKKPVVIHLHERYGIVQHTTDLGQKFVDAGYVREGHAVAGGLIAACPRAAERSQDVLDVSGSPHQPEEQEHEENRRAEPEQQVLPPGASGVERLGVDDDALLLKQLRQGVVVGERGNLGAELRRRLVRGVLQLLVERALNRRALGRDLLHMAGLHLLDEERAVRNANA